jgi:X-Pro dipeptidyl-peptidase
MMNRWFTRYLFDVDNGIEEKPHAWITRENDNRTEPTSYPDYPHPDAVPVALYPGAGAPQHGTLMTQKSGGQGQETLVDNFSFSSTNLARAEWTDHRLMYTTPILSDSLHISGTPRITISLASSTPAANLSVMLVSLPWNEGRRTKITDNIITRGWADPQNHASLTESEPLKPGTFYEIAFDLQPDDQIIPPGQQIGLMIFSSDRDFTLHPDPGTELTIDLDATSLTLPIVGGRTSIFNE